MDNAFKRMVPATFAAALSLSVSAQTDTLMFGNQELQAIEIVAKSKARKLQEQAYAISVVDLKANHATSTPMNKILNTVSSVRIREDGGVGSNYTFAMNGFSGNQVKFFLDGIPMDNFGSSFNLANLSANLADRVEVYKGVLPVHLGADALGGAVNIVSRINANYLDATYSVGSFNTHKASVNGAYTNTRTGFTLRANAFFNYSKNDYKVFAPIVDLPTGRNLGDRWVRRFNDDYHSAGLKMETGLVGRPWADQMLVGVILSENDKHIQTGATMDAVYGKVKSGSFSLIPTIRYKKTNLFTPGLDLSLYGTYNVVNTNNVDTAAVAYNWLGESIPATSRGEGYLTDALIQERQWQGNANLNYVISDHQSVTLNHVVTAMRRKQDDREYPDYPMNGQAQHLTKNITGLAYRLMPSDDGTGTDTKIPVRLAVTENGTENIIESDREFTLAIGKLFEEYDMTIYSGGLTQNEIGMEPTEAAGLGTEFGTLLANVNVFVDTGTLTVRGTVENDPTTPVLSEAPDNVTQITAVESEGAKYFINDS